MATVADLYAAKGRRPLIAFDFSPPRSGDVAFAEEVRSLDVDLFCVAYSPGRAVRMDTVAAAATLKWRAKREVIFNLACRDMNRLAVQMHLLGAQALGLENVLVVRGDDFKGKDVGRVKAVNDFRPTELIAAIGAMNQGIDFKGLKLAAPTSFCVGAIVDPHRDLEREAALALRKVEAGAEFLLTQAVYHPQLVSDFHRRYEAAAGARLSLPVLWGVQVLVRDGVAFGDIPEAMLRELERGRSGVEMAVDLMRALMERGCDAFYVVPPIMKGGARDYQAAQEVASALKAAAP